MRFTSFVVRVRSGRSLAASLPPSSRPVAFSFRILGRYIFLMLEIARQRSGGGGPSDLEVIQSALEWAGVIFRQRERPWARGEIEEVSDEHSFLW